MKSHKQGFTLVEVLVVIVIIFLLVTVSGDALKDTPEGYPAGTRVNRIDGCEYIESGVYNNATRTHKGNCDNPIHYPNQNLEK